jgi:hypothetical protein
MKPPAPVTHMVWPESGEDSSAAKAEGMLINIPST